MAEHQPIIIKKVKGGHGGGHHGGSWKVAYADFVTAMMTFFIVMWIMGLSADNKAIIQGYFNDPLGFSKNEPRSKSIIAMPGANPGTKPGNRKVGEEAKSIEDKVMQELETKIRKGFASEAEVHADIKSLLKDITISITDEGLLIELTEKSGTLFFESGSWTIRPEGHRLIQRLAPILRLSGKKMIIEGHTDAQPYSRGDMNNWKLSSMRALALQTELSAKGIPDSQFAGVRGWADTHLKLPDKPLDSENRRVSILLPRTYKEGDKEALPADELKMAQSEEMSTHVGVKPEPLNLRQKGKVSSGKHSE